MPMPGMMPSHGGNPEPCIVARHAQVTRQGNLEAAADAVRVNGRDHDSVEHFQLAKRRFPVSEERHAGLALGQRREVDATAEGAARAADDDDSHVLLAREVVDQRAQIACPLLVRAVQDVRAIERSGSRPGRRRWNTVVSSCTRSPFEVKHSRLRSVDAIGHENRSAAIADW
jgi:hypothetical protein